MKILTIKKLTINFMAGLLVCVIPLVVMAHDDDELGRLLSTHEDVIKKLIYIKKYSWLPRWLPMKVGPLIKNGHNGGLIDIDTLLPDNPAIKADVCGEDTRNSTVREAVLCTITDGIGNLDGGKIGLSTQGRELWAARLGNPFGTRVFYITQQHGNEPAGTEAVLRVLKSLTRPPFYLDEIIMLLSLDIIILVRANPDGGEYDPRNCFVGAHPLGQVVATDCGLTRTNIDLKAGGGYTRDSEPDFFGVVGVGYNLNRYHYPGLDVPIRPVESQAMVAAIISSDPDYVIDLHGDLQKTVCRIDPDSINPGAILGAFTNAACIFNDPNEPLLGGVVPESERVVFSPVGGSGNEDGGIKQKRARTLLAKIARGIQDEGFGKVTRFGQIQTGAGIATGGTAGAYADIGPISIGWESANFDLDVALGARAVVNGAPQFVLTTGKPDAKTLEKQININAHAFVESLMVVTKFKRKEPQNEAGYCDIPIPTGIAVATLAEEFFGPNPFTETAVILTTEFNPVSMFDSCKNNP